jgi:LmbE family N-acetylglucosaminyl deacetylase
MSETDVARILVITAHPDDVDFGAAGSVASWTSAGIDVSYCVVTDGDAGGFDHSITRAEMAELRRKEQRAAAKIVGVDSVTFLGYPDGRLEATLDLRRDISRVIRSVRPDRVLSQSPDRNWTRIYASHPDHLAAGAAAVAAVYPDARNPYAFPELVEEGYEPHSVPELWLMAHPESDTYVDITDTIDKKLDALRAHESQRTDADGQLGERMRGWAMINAQRAGYPEGRLAESFLIVDTR